MTEVQFSSKHSYVLLTEGGKGEKEEEHALADTVKFLNEKQNCNISEDERPLVEGDYEARKHLKFVKSIYDPPGGFANGRCRNTSITSQDDVSITSLSDFMPSQTLRRRRRLFVAGVITCIIVSILTITAVVIHFATQHLNAVYIDLQAEDPVIKYNSSCGHEEFQCNILTGEMSPQSPGSCIPRSYVCDRKEDCPDGEDEKTCTYWCPAGQMACKTGVIAQEPFRGFCIQEDEICNGQVECSDRSDEEECPAQSCRDDEFSCKTNTSDGAATCLSRRQQCDRVADCVDGVDEVNCTYSCPAYEFLCSTGVLHSSANSHWPEYCLEAAKVCDGINHCADGSDEQNCSQLCSAGEFFCNKGFNREEGKSRCIDESLVCDRRHDCTDGSDEANCTYSCPRGMEACRTGTLSHYPGYCYRTYQTCDSFRDCEDGSDEEGCELLCSDNEFKCKSIRQPFALSCIRKEHVCDGQRDCADGTDETNCNDGCPEGHMSCEDDAGTSKLPTTCIPLTQKCNGFVDCPDGKDEEGCSVTCDVEQFKCVRGVNKINDSLCLDKIYRCDRVEDCSDGSDERACQYVCPPGMVRCESGTIWDPTTKRQLRGYCISDRFKCDGKTQCSDGSDEAGCPCSEGEFECVNGRNTYDVTSQCIDEKHFCDGVADCTDRSDEANCTYARYDCTKLNKASVMKLRCDGRVDCKNGEDEKDCDISCSPEEFRCRTSVDHFTGSICINKEYRCDRVEDCIDGSDENSCEYQCPDGTFMCTTKSLYNQLTSELRRGYCVPDEMKCDGQKQCADGSDEEFCSCPDNQFRCRSGRNNFIHTSRCVRREHVCDKVADCSDSSDELDCDYSSPTCDYFDVKIRCDGVPDCANGEDEQNCDTPCSLSEFRCKTGVDKRTGSVCLTNAYRCDGLIDCVDKSDEDPFSCNYTCPRGSFPCKFGPLKDPVTGSPLRGFCLEEALKCDGVVQCMDGTDEESCPCREGEFTCTNGFNIYSRVSRCIPIKHRCDGTADCTDRSDEEYCA